MSRIGKQLITIPAGVTVTLGAEGVIMVKGPKGELSYTPTRFVKVEVKDDKVIVTRIDDSKDARSFHGLTRSLINNMVEGVTKAFEKRLEINGVGYKAQIQGNKVILQLGYSHPIEHLIPEGITVAMDPDKKNLMIISGIDKQKVGQTAAEIRAYRKPEPYKGKGIKYEDEYIRRKAGKAASAA
jgi:large subunit ribosomal protein L6